MGSLYLYCSYWSGWSDIHFHRASEKYKHKVSEFRFQQLISQHFYKENVFKAVMPIRRLNFKMKVTCGNYWLFWETGSLAIIF